MNKYLLIAFCVIGALAELVSSEISLSEGNKYSTCADRSGLQTITSAMTSENGCRLDCIVLGNHRQYNLNEGKECHTPGDWKCFKGRCLNADERLKSKRPDETLYDVKIQIKSAYVQDEDKFPVNGESDVFVIIKVYNAPGIYEEGAVIGNTPTIQDTNRPVWQDFILKPNPLPLDSRIKFVVFDSDKPVKPDYLGSFEAAVGELVDRSNEKLYLTLNNKENRPFHIVATVQATKMESVN